MSKAWERKHSYNKRVVNNIRYIRNRILILCEGEKTEPNYFRAFPLDIELVELDVKGSGANTLSLVKDAIRRRDEAAKQYRYYNQIWCVFDRDSFPAGNFNQAFQLANRHQIRTAYSNQCFELWYYLHYWFIDTAIDRKDYATKLTEFLEKKYKKNDEEMYKLLEKRQPQAIKNAKKLMSRYIRCNPEKDDPSTTVYKLVETLNTFLPDDSD